MLYLKPASRDSTDATLADGVTEELIARLSQVEGLRVTSRYAALRFRGPRPVDPRQAGRELGVRYVLQGTLRRAGDRVRVSVEITEAGTGFNVWAERYEQTLPDVFAMEDSVAVHVAEAVRGRLTTQERRRLAPQSRTANPEAYQAYLRARAAVRARTSASGVYAIAQYRRAIGLDPTFAPAHAGLAHAYTLAANWSWDLGGTPTESLYALAALAAARAVALDSTSALAWTAAAVALREQEPRRALRYARRAVTLDSSDAEVVVQLGFAFMAAGELDSAIAAEEWAARRDPYYAFAYSSLAGLLNIAGRPLDALRWAEQARAIDSTHASTYWQMADAYLQLGRPVDARTAAARAVAFGVIPLPMRVLAALGDLTAGDTVACRAELKRIAAELADELARSPGGLTNLKAGLLSGAYARLGETELAITWLRRVSPNQRRFYHLYYVRHWLWKPIRNDARFQALLAELTP